MDVSNTIREIGKSSAEILSNVAKNGAKNLYEFNIDCRLLDDYNHIDIRDSENFKILFKQLSEIIGPCLYYFEITSNNTSAEIVAKIKYYSSSPEPKSTPAIKTKYPDSKYLYVGKVKRLLWGRIIQHMGYYPQPKTQGLQLFYWTKDLNLSMKLVILEFEPEMINLMEVLESELAKKLQPILGKHR